MGRPHLTASGKQGEDRRAHVGPTVQAERAATGSARRRLRRGEHGRLPIRRRGAPGKTSGRRMARSAPTRGRRASPPERPDGSRRTERTIAWTAGAGARFETTTSRTARASTDPTTTVRILSSIRGRRTPTRIRPAGPPRSRPGRFTCRSGPARTPRDRRGRDRRSPRRRRWRGSAGDTCRRAPPARRPWRCRRAWSSPTR